MDTKRLTDEQRNFRDAMQIMIDLYYLIKDINIDLDIPEFIIKLAARLFYKTIPNFSPCIYFPKERLFHYRLANEVISFGNIRNHPERVSFQNFISLVDSIRKNIKDNNSNLFFVTDAARSLHLSKRKKELIEHQHSNKKNSITGFYKDKSSYNWIDYDNFENSKKKSRYMKGEPSIQLFDDSKYFPKKGLPSKGFNKKDFHNELVVNSISFENLNDPPPYREVYKIEYGPDPWNPLLINENFSHCFRDSEENNGEKKTTVSSPGISELTERNLSIDSFYDVIRFIIVKYIALFGSFDRIKVCKNCDKLFYEKKYGSSIFCNDKCRVNFHVESQPKKLVRCQARQNRWLGRKLLYPDTIKKDDCEECRDWESFIKSGTCKKVQEKNKKKL